MVRHLRGNDREQSVIAAHSLIRPGAEPIELEDGSSRCVMMVHGFGDTPQTLHYLAERLSSAGYRVSVPLLPGHGTTPEEFFRSTADEWLSAARARLLQLREECGSVALVGLSMGAAISVVLAAELPDIPALVLLSPYLALKPLVRVAAATHRVWAPFVGPFNAHHPESIRDPVERGKNVGYGVVAGGALKELQRVAGRARQALGKVKTPTLVVQSLNDPRIPPKTGVDTLKRLGAAEKKIVWIEGAGHIITVDFGKERVLRETTEWIERHTTYPPRRPTAAAGMSY